jgi:hypothetical protein
MPSPAERAVAESVEGHVEAILNETMPGAPFHERWRIYMETLHWLFAIDRHLCPRWIAEHRASSEARRVLQALRVEERAAAWR